MKFPLPLDTFPPLVLTHEDERVLEDAAEVVIQRTIGEYFAHLTINKGVVDEKRWKKLKTRDSVTAYRERRASVDDSASSVSSSSSSSSKTADEASGSAKTVTALLTVGTLPGQLDDVMYGMLNTTTEEMQLKTAYVEDGFVDSKLLATIAKPSEKEPFRDLSLKWAVKGHPLLLGAVMRNRDAVLIESTGIAFTPSGERVGYHMFHSVAVDGVRELEDEYEILRLDMSVCNFFRQRDDKCVEVYGRGVVGPSGDVPSSLLSITLAEVGLSVFRYVHCAEMKKLTRIIQSSSRIRDATTETRSCGSFSSRSSSDHESQSAVCALCLKNLKGMLPFASSGEKSCRICGERVCSRCRVHKTVYLSDSQTESKKLTAADMAFCTRCIHLATTSSSHAFAVLDVRAAQGKRVDFGSLRGQCSAEPTEERSI
ncbi:hypothetical protein Gpo141_00003896 [Globisporangium polare]